MNRLLKRFGLSLDVYERRASLRREGCGRSLLRVEWALGRDVSPGVSLAVTGEPDIVAHVALPLVGLWVSKPTTNDVQERWAARAKDVGARRYDGVDIVDVSVHDRAIWWSLMHPQMSWESKTPRWRNGSFHPVDALLGSPKYTSEPIVSRDVQIPMPEGTYDWTITLSRDTWRRPRWPFHITRVRAKADAKKGEHIPMPGKGENSWDCGADALHGSGAEARTIKDAIGSVVASVLRSRQRHGGDHVFVEGGKYEPPAVAA